MFLLGTVCFESGSHFATSVAYVTALWITQNLQRRMIKW